MEREKPTAEAEQQQADLHNASVKPNESFEEASNSKDKTDYIPITLLLANSAQKHVMARPLLCLLDSGASHTWIHRGVLPDGVTPKSGPVIKSTTLAGKLKSNQHVLLQNSALLELYRTHKINEITAFVFDADDCRYNVFFGRDVLQDVGFKLDFENSYRHDVHRPTP